MKAMRSLFFRIFLSFWLMMTGIGAAFAVIYAIAGGDEAGRRRAVFTEIVRTQGELAAYRSRDGQRAEAERGLRALRERHGTEVHVLTAEGDVLGGLPPAELEAHAARLEAGESWVAEADGAELIAVRAGGDIVTARVPRVSKRHRVRDESTLPFRVLAVFLVSGLASYLLARYLTRPLGRLRDATQRFAEGDLSVRVSHGLSGAAGEIVALGTDFDRMAERIEQLLAAQKRLLRDVSHELRSPLARLSVALGLARKRAPAELGAPLDRIELESERLSELIGRILTVTRLETARAAPGEIVDVGALLDEIVRDARYEAQGERRVTLSVRSGGELFGDPVSLREAVENVIRNALRITGEGTEVEVELDRTDGGSFRIAVRDRGPGVPEPQLGKIFEPFYRVDSSRDRMTGGTGIGLAIAELGVRLHEGSIRAENAEGGGLRVTIDLPATGLRA
jgi:signal transduction histidine kinase